MPKDFRRRSCSAVRGLRFHWPIGTAEPNHTRSIPKNEKLHKLIGKLEGLEQSHQAKSFSSATNKTSTKRNNGNIIKRKLKTA